MSYGAACRYAAAMGAGVVDVEMPGNIRDEIVTIGTAFKTLDAAIQKARAATTLTPFPSDFISGWAAFYAEWQTFAKNHDSWLSNVWYASYEKAKEYRSRLEDWRKKFIDLGGKISSPSPGAAPGAPGPTTGVNWKMLLYVAAGIGAVYAATRFLGQAVEVKREIVGTRPVVGHVPEKAAA